MNSDHVISGHLMSYARQSPCLLLLGLIVAGLSGCGDSDSELPERAPVMGTVTLDGKMLAQGVIRFVPIEGAHGPQTTAKIEEGVFLLPAERGPFVGKHRVEIESTDTGGLAMDDEEALVKLQTQVQKPKIEVVRVPAAYNDRSKLTAEIPKGGRSDLEYKLLSNPKSR